MRNLSKITLIIFLLLTSSCNPFDHWGFDQPLTIRMTVPDGPPEFKAAWYAGCKSALASSKTFANAFVYEYDYGSGVYQHDPVYQATWAQSYFNCSAHAKTFMDYHSTVRGPLE
jgi:hypothetical protein